MSRCPTIVIRFIGGGLITAAIGVIAREWGPVVGGLFLAFPSIFPAASSLVERHAKDKRSHTGADGVSRARHVAALDAAGATIGSVGLLVWLGIFGAAVVTFVTAYEEPTLRETYGESYDAYRAAVPGWWPRLTPWRGSDEGPRSTTAG